MKKSVLSIILIVAMIMPMWTVSASQEISDITIYINNERVQLDVQPVIRNNRTLVPIRGVFEKLGAQVDWNQSTGQVIVKDHDMELLLDIGNKAVLLNGQVEFLDTGSMLIDDRTLIPLRFVAESLGYDVIWRGDTHRIDINTGKEVDNNAMTDLPVVGNKEALEQLLSYNMTLNGYVTSRFNNGLMMEDVMGQGQGVDDSPKSDNALDISSDAGTSLDKTEEAGLDSSSTNNQVDGVEEGDVIKTDGRYIYYVADKQVKIINADPTNPRLESEISLDDNRGSINDIYISDNRLVVLGTSYVYYALPVSGQTEDMNKPIDYPTLPLVDVSEAEVPEVDVIGPSIKESRLPYYSTTNTFVMAYDLSDITKPELVIDMDIEGLLASSRMVKDKLYLVTNKGLNYYDILQRPEEDYRLKPKYMNNLTGETRIIDYDQIKYFPQYVEANLMTTLGIDLSTYETDMDAYLGRSETLYASSEYMYLTFTSYEYTNSGGGLIYVPDYEVNTAIYKFKLEDGHITYVNEGKVEGSVLNQFSLDEYEGNLRIATTKGNMWDQGNPSVNNIYILDDNLDLLGQVEDLAQGERIYSTRFSGDRIYMVTYKQIDPFFVIDASDPTRPKVLGQLKIPGFSTYMHILDENHVLGFGKDTIDQDGFTTSGGFKLSLFDVTDPENPIEEKQEIIGIAGTYSELEYNHKALMISLTKGLMAFPISLASSTPYVTDFVGAYVYDLSQDGFTYRGNITHLSDGNKYNDENYINRIIYIGDYLYSLSSAKMKVTAIDGMKAVGELELK